MSFTTYATAIAGTVLTAAFWNQQIRDNGNIQITSIDTPTGKLSGNIKAFYEDAPAVSIASNVLTVDLAVQNVVPFSFNANINTTTLNNKPPSGKFVPLTFFAIANGSPFTWAWLTSTVVWDGAVQPIFVTTNGHVMCFMVTTYDNGATWRGIVPGSNYAS